LRKLRVAGNVSAYQQGCSPWDRCSSNLKDPYKPLQIVLAQPYHMENSHSQDKMIPADAAKEIGVSVHTIRRWCEWHAAALSAAANPPPGAPRQLTWHDIEIFKTVKDLRARGLQTQAINEQLAGMTFATIESGEIEGLADSAPDEQLLVPMPQTPSGDAQALMLMMQTLSQRVETLDKNNRESRTAFFFGVVVGVFLMFAFILIALSIYR
jgi:DNA-binding transcriptional MerR regulator